MKQDTKEKESRAKRERWGSVMGEPQGAGAGREIFSASGLSVGYGGTVVIGGIDIRAERGEILTILGPNGAGKSTILKTLIRELQPLEGVLYLNGENMGKLAGRQIARQLSAVLTARPRTELMTCEDVVATGRYPYTGTLGILSPADREILSESMELVRVTDLKDRDFNCISDGQRQRVLLARAICQEPRLLILDEPTSFLDVRHKLDFLCLLRDLVRKKDISVILTLHELDLAQRFSDRLLCVRDGQVDRTGTPEEIFGGYGAGCQAGDRTGVQADTQEEILRGSYIDALYGIERGSYDPLSGGIEMQAVKGEPACFVLGGGGSGIPVYRALRRMAIPFAAGVLPENDLDWPVASRLSSVLISEAPFEPVCPASVDRALEILRNCRFLVCTVPRFGSTNGENRRLLDYAEAQGKILPVERLASLKESFEETEP